MTTKTVAYVKDSIYLDALQYRQSSGRAGSRGFDVQGHVVFVDIPLSKIRSLIFLIYPSLFRSVLFLLPTFSSYYSFEEFHEPDLSN